MNPTIYTAQVNSHRSDLEHAAAAYRLARQSRAARRPRAHHARRFHLAIPALHRPAVT